MNILFQGDSITDAGRDRQHSQYMGNGYVSEIAIRLKAAGKKTRYRKYRRRRRQDMRHIRPLD